MHSISFYLFITAWQIKVGMFSQSEVLLYGGCVPALKEASVDTTGIRLGAGLTITELDHSLKQLEAQLDGKT